MKKLLLLLLSPVLAFAAAGDIKIDVKNSSDTAWITTIFAKQNGALLGTSGSGVPQLYTTIPSTITWNGSVIDGQYGGTGVANTGKTITLGGSFTTSGAFTTTLTVGANTNVTLPSSGTLAALGGTNAWTGVNTFSNATPIILTTAATGGFQINNLADITTNFERGTLFWTSNVLSLRSTTGGTGTTGRTVEIRAYGNNGSSGSNFFQVNPFGPAGAQYTFGGNSSSTSNQTGVWIQGAGTQTQTTGSQVTLLIDPTYNQTSGNASNTSIKITNKETAVGSGVQAFLDFYSGSGGTTQKFTMLNTGIISLYGGLATAGNGVATIQGAGRATAQTGANASFTTYTVGSSDASFLISANVNVTTSTTHNFTVTCAYTDETNTARTLTLGFTQLSGGTFLTAITNVTGAGPYESIPYHIRCKASTAITFATTGTFTTVTYNAEGIVAKLQ